MFKSLTSFTLLALAASNGVLGQKRPDNTSICDFYTTALLKNNTAENQLTVLTLVVNTAVIGNYSNLSKIEVPGILNPNATFQGRKVDLLKYFTGSIASSNVNNTATAVNWLDGGGADPLKKNLASNNTASRQEALIQHLYSFFGTALNCSQIGQGSFKAYSGSLSMYKTHQFMHLDNDEVSYFNQQVGLSAKSFGVADSDISAVGKLLDTTFNRKCSPAAALAPGAQPDLQSICIADDCQQAQNANCSAYGNIAAEPSSATSTAPSPTETATGTPGAGAPQASDGAGVSNKQVTPLLAALAGLFAFVL